MKRICHAADIHIRPYKYLDEMRYTFDRFYESLRENRVDLTVIVGDIFHSKLTPSHEYFEIAADFFHNISQISDVIVTLGNHDLALGNQNRQDAISPVIKAVNSPRIIFSKHTEQIPYGDDFVFHNFSILDEKEKWPTEKDIDKNKINISLYHGTINGIVFDNGWVSRGNRDDIDIFKGFDYNFLGDIHKFQFLDKEKRTAYPGSLRQNNFSEDVEKGYLLWEIATKDDFEVERVILPQKRYFFTLYGKSTQDIEEVGELPEDCRIRFQLTENVDVVEQLKIKAEIEKLYKPCNDVPILPPKEDIDLGNISVGKADILHENIRLPESQISLIKEYFKEKNISKKDLEDLIQLDKKYHSYVNTDVLRNTTFKLQKMKWDNMFSYGKGNEIDFSKLSGLVGLFGNNWSGKSSLIDTLTLGVFNQVFKEGANKNVDYVNRRCKNASIDIDLSMNNKAYKIQRTLKKKSTKKGEDKCDTSVEFLEDGISANGETKPETNKEIRNKFGTDEDFAFTTLCSQFGLTKFIDARGTKRKEILAKYFDLDIFDTKYQLANEESKRLKAKMDGHSFSKSKSLIDEYELSSEKKSADKELLEQEAERIQNSLVDISGKIQRVTAELDNSKTNVVDIEKLYSELNKETAKVKNFDKQLEGFVDKKISDKEADEASKKLQDLKRKIWQTEDLIKQEEKSLKSNKHSLKLLEEIPNVSACRSCSLAKHAFDGKEEIPQNEEKIETLKDYLDVLCHEMANQKYDQIIHDHSQAKLLGFIPELREASLYKIENLKKNIAEAEKNREKIEKRKDLEQELANLKKEKASLSRQKDETYKTIIALTTSIATLKEKVATLQNNQKEYEDLSRQKYLYDLYLDAMGKNGISYWIISKKMPILNRSVNQILAQCVDFRLKIENNEEEKSIKVHIANDKGTGPIELGSGAEKTISSIALRAALWNVCLLPKTPILILDEAFSYLDADKHDGIIKLLTYLKSFFDAIIIITHDNNLKTVMDDAYHIEVEKGYAKIKMG